MKRLYTKAIAILLAVAMLMGFGNGTGMGLQVSAAGAVNAATAAESTDEADTSGLTVRDSATIAPSGSVKWTLYTNGLLEFSGIGVIPSYAEGASPWYQYGDSITEILVRKTITEIGSGAFYGCKEVTEITLPFVGKSRTTTTGIESTFGYIFGYSSVGTAYSTKCSMFVISSIHNSSQYIDTYSHTHGYKFTVRDINGNEKKSLENEGDSSLIPDVFAEPILVYGTCMRLKSNPQHVKFAYWLSMYNSALANMRSKISIDANSTPSVKLYRY